MLPELTLQLVLLRFLAFVVIAAVQGAAIAGTAVLLGDQGPRYDRRLTLNPLSHLDLLGGASFIVFGLGWTKPVAVDYREFRMGRGGVAIVVAAALAALLLTAVVLRLLIIPLLTGLPYSAGLTTAVFLRLAAELCIWTAVLNILPIPPLTGGQLLAAFDVKVSKRVEWLLGIALVVAAATGLLGALLDPVYAALASIVIGG